MTSIKPRTASVIIYQGDDMERLAELRQAAEFAARQSEDAERASARIGDESMDETVREARDAYDAAVSEAADRAVKVEVRALGRRAFRDLMAEHPPRKVQGAEGEEDHEDDWLGVNMSSFPDALLTYVGGSVRTITSPDFGSRTECQRFLDEELSDGQYDEIFHVAYGLNRTPSADPFVSRYSAGHRSTDETSTSPERLG